MFRHRSTPFWIAAVVLLLVAGTGSAEQGDSELGLRALWVTASATGTGTFADSGSSPKLSSGPGFELDWVLWPLDELTVELSVGVSALPVTTTGGAFSGIDGGTLWRFPVSAVAQYRPDLFGAFDPYVGLGVVYNVTAYRMSSAYGEFFSDGAFSDDLSIVAQVGVNYEIDVRWSANLDLRYMGMKTTGTFTGLDGSPYPDVEFKLDPWVVGLGFRFRY